MAYAAYLLDWGNLLVRWLHLIAGIAWIGASFYFIMLDASLKPPRRQDDGERGVSGELWAVHGGGFYCSQKFLTGPRGEPLSEDLHWSKWEAYTTWLSGMGMLVLVYWLGAPGTLVDARVLALSPAAAAGVSMAFLAGGWLLYDLACRWLGQREKLFMLVLTLLVLGADYLAHLLFAPRGAYIHVGAFMGTCMAANVFFHIIPGQKRMVAALRAGQPVDPRPGIIGKQRSVHNTYFTLPVLFIMLSNHYPMTFGHAQGPLVLALIMAAGVLIRQFFVLRHRHQASPWYLLLAVVLLLATMAWLAPPQGKPVKVEMAQVEAVVARRCTSCHSAHPTQPGFLQPPKGIILEGADNIRAHGALIHTTVASGYMPLGNLTGITPEERQLLLDWSQAP